jgi:hypothetical protein
MNPCNSNSECIFNKHSNTFSCRCLNGAESCDSTVSPFTLSPTPPQQQQQTHSFTTRSKKLKVKTEDKSQPIGEQIPPFDPNPSEIQSNKNKQVEIVQSENEIPELAFNYENVKH